jgi:nitroreductase
MPHLASPISPLGAAQSFIVSSFKGEMMPQTDPARSDPGTSTAKSVDVIDAIRRRRMHREFVDRPIPRSVLLSLAWAAGRAQHARAGVRNLIVVDDPRLLRTAREVLPGYVNNSTAMIIICSNLDRIERVAGVRGVDHTSRLDSGAAAAHLALAAQCYGIGTCTVTSWSETAVRTLFDLPANIRPDITVALGYIPNKAPPGPKGGFGPSIHHNVFGSALSEEA